MTETVADIYVACTQLEAAGGSWMLYLCNISSRLVNKQLFNADVVYVAIAIGLLM